MNNHKDETGGLTGRNDHPEASRHEGNESIQETTLGDLEPQAEIKGGGIPGLHKASDVTLKRGVIG